MKMREAIPADATTIRAIALATVSQSEGHREQAIARAYQPEEIVRAISSSEEAKEQLFIVGETDGEVVGFYHAIDRGGMWEMLRLYLHPRVQRHGYGTAFLAHLQHQKKQPVELYVESTNEPALAFLTKQAFREVSRIQEDVYDEPMELVQMTYTPH